MSVECESEIRWACYNSTFAVSRVLRRMDGQFSSIYRARPLLDIIDQNWASETLPDDGKYAAQCSLEELD